MSEDADHIFRKIKKDLAFIDQVNEMTDVFIEQTIDDDKKAEL